MKNQKQLKAKVLEILNTGGNVLIATKYVKDNSGWDLRSSKDFVDNIRKEQTEKQSYIIVGDDNYWYATATNVTKDELVKIVRDTINMINKGGQFTPTPSSTPNELYAYPVGYDGKPIDFLVD